jgi:hypothetical protein
MDKQYETNLLIETIKKIVKQEMGKKENYLTLFLPGEIDSVDGNFADVKINGSTDVTPDIPINPSISVIAGDSVWVLKVNFQDQDLIILCKRVVS